MSRVFTEDELRTYKSHTEQQLRKTVADRDRTIGTLQRRLAACTQERSCDKTLLASRDMIIESLKEQLEAELEGVRRPKQHVAAVQVEVDQPTVETCSVCGGTQGKHCAIKGRTIGLQFRACPMTR